MKPEQWIVGPDTSTSSMTIWAVMMGVRKPDASPPFDVCDFAHCHRLLETFPEWRPRLHEVAEVYPEWTTFVEHWNKLSTLHMHDDDIAVYDLIKALQPRDSIVAA